MTWTNTRGDVLCCLGDVVEDIVVWLDASLSYGTDTSSRIVRSRGGSAANSAAFAAAVGCRARFAGCVGADDLGDRLIATLERDGVHVCAARAGKTGTIVVIVDPTGERTMLTDRGAASELRQLPERALERVGVLHLPVYSLMPSPLAEVARDAISQVRTAGAKISIDVSSIAALAAADPAGVAALDADYLFCGERELALLPELAARCVVVKRGDANPLVVRAGSAVEAAVDRRSAAVRDTTGAGDAFAAGFLAAVLSGVGEIEAARAGHALAQRVLASPGATLAR